jgi:hypothetical protein
MEASGQFHVPAALLQGGRTLGAHWMGGRVDPSADLDGRNSEERNFLWWLSSGMLRHVV